MLVYYEVVEFVCFFIFKDCLQIFVMFFNVDMCKTALIAGESTDYAIIFIELLKFFWEVLTIIFGMHVYLWRHFRGRIRGEEGFPYPFWKVEKIAIIICKNAFIVFIHRLNIHLCLIQNAILRVLRKKNYGFSLMCRRWMFIETPLC